MGNTTAHSTQTPTTAQSTFDVSAIRKQFPILNRQVHGKQLVYLDSAATAQKPDVVIDAEAAFYRNTNSNVHRGVHQLSVESTDAYERAREQIARLINAASADEVIFTSGATESINLVASSYGGMHVGPDDEVLITHMEHHSNIVPWQLLCERTGATLRVVPVTDRGELDMNTLRELLTTRTKIVSVVHISNTLGTINPIREIAALAHGVGAVCVIDGAQGLQHLAVDVRELGCDFYAAAGHKMFGPTGTGFLYGRKELLDAMPPWKGGGSMIRNVSFSGTTYADVPARFEAGTPHIAGAVGLGAAATFLQSIDRQALQSYEHDLLAYATEQLSGIAGVRIIGEAADKASVISFVIEGIHPHDIGTVLDNEGVAVRTGHHCTQPLMEQYNVPATARLSLAMYNTRDEIDALVQAVRTAIEVFDV